MTAEEAIDIIERATNRYPTVDADIFAQRVREDLSLFRRQAHSPMIELTSDGEVEYPPPRPEFSVPNRYSNNAELWIVFSAFVTCFIDPIQFGVHVLRIFTEMAGDSEIERITIVSEVRKEEDSEEIELLDFKRLALDSKELISIAIDIGRSLLGDDFNFHDFNGGREGNG